MVSIAGAEVRPYGPLPLAFEGHDEHYVWRGAGNGLTITPGAAEFQLRGATGTMRVVGNRSRATMEGLDRMPGRVSYFAVSGEGETYDLYGQVLCRSVYP